MKIKDAEAEAEAIRASAAAEARERIARTEELGRIFCSETEEKVESENRKKVELVKERADAAVAHARAAAEESAQKEYGSGGFQMREAIRYIIGGITEKCQ